MSAMLIFSWLILLSWVCYTHLPFCSISIPGVIFLYFVLWHCFFVIIKVIEPRRSFTSWYSGHHSTWLHIQNKLCLWKTTTWPTGIWCLQPQQPVQLEVQNSSIVGITIEEWNVLFTNEDTGRFSRQAQASTMPLRPSHCSVPEHILGTAFSRLTPMQLPTTYPTCWLRCIP